MANVKVWRYRIFDNGRGTVDSERYATLTAIQVLGGKPIAETETLIDEALLDWLGRAPSNFRPEGS